MGGTGETTLTHHGVWFLNDLPEFSTCVLQVTREPMEEKVVTISRARAFDRLLKLGGKIADRLAPSL